MHRRPNHTARNLSRLLSSALLGAVAMSPLAAVVGAASAQSSDLLKQLNSPYARISDKSKSAKAIFTAYLDVTKAPRPIGEDFSMTAIYPGMDGWAEVAKWAEANAGMGKALVENENAQLLGVPYGTTGVDRKFVDKGLVAVIGVDDDLTKVSFPYIDAFEVVNAYVAADMYRLCEAGKFDEAFKLGMAHLRVLRQGCDASMFAEKTAFMTMLCDAFSIHRDMLYAYHAKIGTETFKRLATKEYPFLRPSDNERLRRLEMPEGDRMVAEEMIEAVFTEDGQPDGSKFAKVFSTLQSQEAPMTAFGASKRWEKIAGVHGSLESSVKKLNDIYDDWWRRWRMRPFDPMMALPTELSRTNEVKYAAVVLSARDIESLFELRRRLTEEFCGTVVGAGLCGYWSQFDAWPNDIEKAYAQFFPKRFDFDPYDSDYGRMRYEELGSRTKGVDSEYGRVDVTGCIVYGRNGDGEFNDASRHAAGGKSDDFVVWPPLRAVSRGQGK